MDRHALRTAASAGFHGGTLGFNLENMGAGPLRRNPCDNVTDLFGLRSRPRRRYGRS
jgi:hypothetical protein